LVPEAQTSRLEDEEEERLSGLRAVKLALTSSSSFVAISCEPKGFIAKSIQPKAVKSTGFSRRKHRWKHSCLEYQFVVKSRELEHDVAPISSSRIWNATTSVKVQIGREKKLDDQRP
jgi:hypothetical protein